MAEETSSLLHYLKKPNPEIDSTWSLKDGRTGTKGSKRAGPHDKQLLHNVLEWEGMEWNYLKPIFDDILDLPASTLPNFEDFLIYPNHLKEISDEDSLDALLIRWTYPVVSTALSIAQGQAKTQHLPAVRDYPQHISMARGGQAWFPNQDRLTPDWAGVILSYHNHNPPGESNDKRRYLNVLPGDTKLSTKFKSELGWGDQRFKDPIIQIFTYCRRASVPYGYLITQEELVIVRLFYGDKKDPNRLTNELNKRLYLEYKSIPWANNINDELTINLALWSLHMLAAKRSPIGTRNELKAGHSPPEKEVRDSMVDPGRSDSDDSDTSSARDKMEYSFKRRRSEDTVSTERRGPRKKRRTKC